MQAPGAVEVLALADVGALPLPGAMVLAVEGDGSETQEPSWATASSAAALEDYLDPDPEVPLVRDPVLAAGLCDLGVDSTLALDVLTLGHAAAVDDGTFGPKTDAVRRFAARRIARTQSTIPAQLLLMPPRMEVPQPTAAARLVARPPAPPFGTPQQPVGSGGTLSAAIAPVPFPVPTPIPVGPAPLVSGAETEARETEGAADALLGALPDALLAYGERADVPAVPDAQRRADRRALLLLKGVHSLRKARTSLVAWLDFADEKRLAGYGLPSSADRTMWFLGRFPGADAESSVRHAHACGLRWLMTHLGLPFDAAAAMVRAFSPAPKNEPAFAEMWPVRVMRHFFVLAMKYDGPDAWAVLPYATAGYIVVADSLRLIDGMRSAPPKVDGDGNLDGVARLTKGKRRATMRPLPWKVPGFSPDPSIPHEGVADKLAANFAMLPTGADSMFWGFASRTGAAASLPTAARWGTERATAARVVSGMAHIMQMAPLSMTKEAARKLAKYRHGPRHTRSELVRVWMWPRAARDEIGKWRTGGGRLGALANRYSRAAEAVLRVTLSRCILERIRSGCDGDDGTLAYWAVHPEAARDVGMERALRVADGREE